MLIVHDDRDSLLGDEEMLAALGYEPIGFDRPADAIAAIRSEPARFDAVLISMAPGLTARNALRPIIPCVESFSGSCTTM